MSIPELEMNSYKIGNFIVQPSPKQRRDTEKWTGEFSIARIFPDRIEDTLFWTAAEFGSREDATAGILIAARHKIAANYL